MSIQKEASLLAKRVAQSSVFDSVRKALSDADRSSPDDPGTILSSMARDLRLQFHGYLDLSSRADEIAEKLHLPESLPHAPFPQDVLQGLAVGDRFLRRVNAEVLRPLIESIGPVAQACDPYLLRPATSISETADSTRLDGEVRQHVAALGGILQRHKSVGEIREVLRQLPAQPEPVEVGSLVAGVVQTTLERESTVRREEVVRLQGRFAGDPPAAQRLLRLLSHVYLLRRSVDSINRLLFEGFRRTKFVTLSENNVFAAPNWKSDLVGEMWTIKFQPEASEYLLDPGSFVYLDPPAEREDAFPRGIAWIVRFHASVNKEMGNEIELLVRPVDDWLNPFPTLMDARI